MFKYKCPHCGEASFSPLLKARCGSMISKGKPCPACGGRCVNGKPSLVAQYVLSIAALVMAFYAYFTAETLMDIVIFGVIPVLSAFVLKFLFDMFFGKLIPALRRQ